MRTLHPAVGKSALILILLSLFSPLVFAQATNSQPRIAAAVNDAQTTVLRGNTHPLARAEFDRGAAPATLPMQHMLMILRHSPAQETALEGFMAEQLDPRSPNFHHWLTPQEFGELYGPAQQDITTVTKWMALHGFQVESVGAGRTTIQFSGTAAQVQSAFHTTIHQYQVKGEQHFANSSDPSIPTALTPVVAGIRSLHNFNPKPANIRRASSQRPSFTFNNGGQSCDVAGDSLDCFTVGANDFATIYDVADLWNGNGTAVTNGLGQTIAIMADSDINLADVAQFRSLFSLPANVPNQIYPTGTSPGKKASGDEIEAALDTEWSGAVAIMATIDLVASPSTNTTFGGDTSAQYVINCQVAGPSCTHGVVPAKIISESFGDCELGLGTVGNTFYNTMWQQAAAEGISVLVSSGDNGSAGCDIDEVNGPTTQPAQSGLQVNGIASTPYNIAVGGTDFNDLGTESTYWNQAVGTQSSVLKYIPETTWNDTCTNAQLFPLITANPPVTDPVTSCSNQSVQSAGLVIVTGGSGGMSTVYAQPCWQGGAIVAGTCPAHSGIITPGTMRDLPDVSLFAGDGLTGSFYVMCELDIPNGGFFGGGQGNQPCALGTAPVFVGVGGTSVSVQAFAGIMALVDEQHGAQGNANPFLYKLDAIQSNACTPGTSCTFNDVTIGTNAMPCKPGTTNCSTTASVPGFPSGRSPSISVRVARIACALCIGLLLLLAVGRKSQRWVTSAALCGALVLLVVSIGCGGGNNGGSQGGGGGGGIGTPEGELTGYSAGAGYDLATGLGSVNAFNLVTNWTLGDVPPSPVANNRPVVTVPVATVALACILCLAMLFVGLRQKQIRWSTAVLLLAFAFSILNAATTRAGASVATHARGGSSVHAAHGQLVSQVVSVNHR